MVRDKNINAGYVVLNPGTASVFNCVHDTVNHNLSAEWIVAGHGDHADRNLFTTGRNALSIGTAAFGAGAVMRYIDFKGVERLAVGGEEAAVPEGERLRQGQGRQDQRRRGGGGAPGPAGSHSWGC